MHEKPGTIVVGIDGSDSSNRALQWAVKQAEAEHRPLTLVHTIHNVTPAFMDAAIVDAGDARSMLDAAGKQVLEQARNKVAWAAPEVEVHEVFDLADPRGVLLKLSEAASMVVVGSRGRGPIRSLLLGSVSVALIRHARCPVVVIRPEHVGTVRNGVVVGVDASPESKPVLEFAYREASVRDLPLTVVHTLWDARSGTTGAYLVAEVTADVDSQRLGLAESMAGMAEKYPDVHVTTRVAKGVPERVLTGLSDRTDLIVVGAHQNSRLSQAIFGSVSVAVVEHASCPVAVVPVSTAT